MLTKKQHELLLYIDQRLRENGISPSFDEMKDALGLKSKSGIHRLITGLEERGFIRRLPHRARALEVLKSPGGPERAVGAFGPGPLGAAGFDAKVIHGDFKSLPRTPVVEGGEIVELPLYGRIAAGTPIDALRDDSNRIGIPAEMLGSGEHYALEVDGDSMLDAGIFDGDIVLIRRCDTAENGSIVVALIDDEEVTLKRLRRKGASVALEPANKRFETRIFGPNQVKIQGHLVALLRKY